MCCLLHKIANLETRVARKIWSNRTSIVRPYLEIPLYGKITG